MMYDFGTGVEELAYAAQSFGYAGSVPFHGWGMEDLRGELAEGRSVVVSLGVDPSLSLSLPWQSGQGTGGDHEPGHMVTVTGVSADGEWVYYNDPTLGKEVVSRAEFERIWGSQGSSGVAVRREAPAGAGEAGPAPWVALAAGLMAAVSGAGLGGLREGVGGALMGSSGASGKKKRSKNYNDDGGTMSLKKAHKRARRKKRRAKRKRRKRKKRERRKNRHGRRARGGVKVETKVLGQGEDPPPPEEEPLERILEQIRDPAFLWSTLTDAETWKIVEKVEGLPDLTIALPMLRGVGYDEMAGPLLRTIAMDEGIQKGGRTLGRLVGDIGFAPLLAVGYGLTVAPEQIENAMSDAPPSECAADLIIDGVGFIGSEVAGSFAGGINLFSGAAAYGFKIGVDVSAGCIWGFLADSCG